MALVVGTPGGRGAGLAYNGPDPAPYVSYTKLTNAAAADWSDVIDLTFRLNRTSDEEYLESISDPFSSFCLDIITAQPQYL